MWCLSIIQYWAIPQAVLSLEQGLAVLSITVNAGSVEVSVLFQTDGAKNDERTVVRLPVDSDILAVILDYAYTDCVPQLTATGISNY